MEIRNYNKGDEHAILELFEIVFKQKLNLKNWLWRFRDNPAGKYLIKLMWDKEQLVGHYAVSPVMMKVNGESIVTALSLTTMTHPEYGGRGVFKKLSQALYDQLSREENCNVIWGFPNNNSHYGFIKYLGWKNLSIIHTLSLSANKINPKKIKFKAELIANFEASHVAFISNKISKFASIHLDISTKYLNWRYISKPNSNFSCFQFKNDNNNTIIIVKPYFLENQNKSILNIIDCFTDDYNTMHDYLIYIKNYLDIQFDEITCWKNIHHPEHLEFEKQGFIASQPITYLSMRANGIYKDKLYDFREWDISMSYSDVY